MSNRLKMANVQAVLQLHAQRWSFRRIAEALHIDRGTVSRYVRLAEARPASEAPTGSEACRPAGSGPVGACDPPPRCGRRRECVPLCRPDEAQRGGCRMKCAGNCGGEEDYFGVSSAELGSCFAL